VSIFMPPSLIIHSLFLNLLLKKNNLVKIYKINLNLVNNYLKLMLKCRQAH
jgi:hypothetical protein